MKNLTKKDLQIKTSINLDELSKKMVAHCKFQLREECWFMLGGLIPVKGVVRQVNAKEEYVIGVRSPVYDYLHQFFMADNNTIFKTKEELEQRYLDQWAWSLKYDR